MGVWGDLGRRRRGAKKVPGAAWPLGLVWVVALAGCEARPEVWTERQAAVDPPELWRVEAVNSDAPAVQICTDSVLRQGFSKPRPEVQGQPCLPTGDPIQTEAGVLQRCTVGDHTLLVRSRTEGGTDAFSVELRVTTLGADPDASAVQTRRYTRLGPCPQGWKIGDSTDRTGRRILQDRPSA